MLSSSAQQVPGSTTRVHKRQRVDSRSPAAFLSIDHSIRSPREQQHASMKFVDSDQESMLSTSPDAAPVAGPSSAGLSCAGPTNGHTNGNGFTAPVINGNSHSADGASNGVHKHGKSIMRVSVPGTTLYDDSEVSREEFVRLVMQTLREVGYVESASTLEAESGYSLEAPEVTEFREHVLSASWNEAEAALIRLGVTDEYGLWEARFYINQQKYLELLEARQTTSALHVLRNQLAPLSFNPEQIHSLSSLIMCPDPEDLRYRAEWDGAAGTSRHRLLELLQSFIPPSIMIPPRRFSTLLQQSQSFQRQLCVYHNPPRNSPHPSLFMDHQCDKAAFPRITTTILEVHTDEVWNLEWSHDGNYLASASKDKSAIIWRIGPEAEPSLRECSPQLILHEHPYPVGCIAWSLDDTILLTSAEQHIKMWSTKTGSCLGTLNEHSETVTTLSWLPDNSGFISGGLDRMIILWDADGKRRDSWGETPIRVTDLAVSPDFRRLVAVGMYEQHQADQGHARGQNGDSSAVQALPTSIVRLDRMIVYDMATKEIEFSTHPDGEVTSAKISQDSRFAIINHSPNEIFLWDLNTGRLVHKFKGHRQAQHVIRSCFGGTDDNFVVSGSEDGNVYVWQRDSGDLLEVLSGHGQGSVNSVAWNPRNERMFASCSDDRTIRIWEAPLMEILEVDTSESRPSSVGKGKGKTKQRWGMDDRPESRM